MSKVYGACQACIMQFLVSNAYLTWRWRWGAIFGVITDMEMVLGRNVGSNQKDDRPKRKTDNQSDPKS